MLGKTLVDALQPCAASRLFSRESGNAYPSTLKTPEGRVCALLHVIHIVKVPIVSHVVMHAF